MQRNKDKSSSVTAAVAHSVISAIHGPGVLSPRVKTEGVPMSQMRGALCALPLYALRV